MYSTIFSCHRLILCVRVFVPVLAACLVLCTDGYIVLLFFGCLVRFYYMFWGKDFVYRHFYSKDANVGVACGKAYNVV